MSTAPQLTRGAIGYFPIHIKLADRRVLVVGGGRAALTEIRRLVEFGALVDVVAPHVVPEIQELVLIHGHKLSAEKRAFNLDDEDAIASHRYALVFACTGQSDQDDYVAKIANDAGVFVNLPDDHDLLNDSSFLMPAVRKRGHVKISVSTDGFSAALARALLERIESSLGGRIDKYMLVLDSIRDKLSALYADKQCSEEDRKRVLNRLAESEDLILAFQRESFEEALQLIDGIVKEGNDDGQSGPRSPRSATTPRAK